MTYQDNYDGSQIFLSLSNRIGLPVDLVNFVIAQVAALCLARLFRKPMKYASPELRHSVCLLIGLFMGYFCFGKQAVHLSMFPLLSYAIIKTVRRDIMGNTVLAVCMAYLSCLHLHRQIYHTGDYTLDITDPDLDCLQTCGKVSGGSRAASGGYCRVHVCPVMVITQRVTSVAYALQDSCKEKSNSSENSLEKFTVSKIPSPLEYFAYTLAFQTLMCGPVVFFKDYITFIEGEQFEENKGHEEAPSPRKAVLYKVLGSIAAAVFYLALSNKYPMAAFSDLIDPTSEVSRTWSALYLLWYAYLSTLVVRCKYYHAWLLSEAICNNSGLGFNGYDSKGRPKWDKVSNIDVFGFEFAGNFRTAVACWNKNTNSWLRFVAYNRGGSGAVRTARVYALSAVWHGFYPGYYLTFFAGGLFTFAARKIRAVVRPLFVEDARKKLAYDIATFMTTRAAMAYATVPFVVLHLAPSLAFYGKLYYSLHFIAVGAIFIPAGRSKRPANVTASHTSAWGNRIPHTNENSIHHSPKTNGILPNGTGASNNLGKAS